MPSTLEAPKVGRLSGRRLTRAASSGMEGNLPAAMGSGLIAFLMRDCCQGHPEVCTPAFPAGACASTEPAE